MDAVEVTNNLLVGKSKSILRSYFTWYLCSKWQLITPPSENIIFQQHFPNSVPPPLSPLLLPHLVSDLWTLVLEALLSIYIHILGQWFPKCGPQTGSISMT